MLPVAENTDFSNEDLPIRKHLEVRVGVMSKCTTTQAWGRDEGRFSCGRAWGRLGDSQAAY